MRGVRAQAALQGSRWAWSLLASASAVVLIVARALVPAPSGLGTHTQLGLPPCAFHQVLGRPCPACGLTTAFAHLAHFELMGSLRAHPLGLPSFLLVVALFVRASVGVVHGEPLSAWLARVEVSRASLVLGLALFCVWCARL